MQPHPASFRDPAGFVFYREGELYRQINEVGTEDFASLIGSGLYDELTQQGFLVAHDEVPTAATGAGRTIRPHRIPFICYPYEWCTSQLRDAALLTVDIQTAALQRGLSLKDATPFNIQFSGTQPIHIDTLSFEKTPADGPPWVAYRQFCQQFLAPLALMTWRDPRLRTLLLQNLEGLPLDLACHLLPKRAFLNLHRWIHLWLHRQGDRSLRSPVRALAPVSLQRRLALADSLRSAILSVPPRNVGSHWSAYEATRPSYSEQSRNTKERVVAEWLAQLAPKLVWDLGCNTGTFSRLAAAAGAYVIAADYDHDCIEALYRGVRGTNEGKRILPLVVDITNPTPALGWAEKERDSFLQRGPVDLSLALAVIHHWAFAGNVPLGRICDLLAQTARATIVEFVPKTDPMSQKLLAHRRDVFSGYSQASFEEALRRRGRIERTISIPGSDRSLYLFISDRPNLSSSP